MHAMVLVSKLENSAWKLILSFHFYMGSRIKVIRLECQLLLPI